MSSKLRTVSWVLLAIVGLLTLLASCASAQLAYWGTFPVGGVEIAEIAGDNNDLLLGLRGRSSIEAVLGGS